MAKSEEKARLEAVEAQTPEGATSPYTHQDNSGLVFPNVVGHSVDEEGNPLANPQPLQPVVMGPPAFGSPDPRTLANVLLTDAPTGEDSSETDEDSRVATHAAAPLADDYARVAGGQQQPVSSGLESMSKADLKKMADEQGVDLPSGATKDEIIEALEAEGASPDYESMNKADLLKMAEAQGVQVDDSMKKEDIVNALNASA